MFQLLVSAIFSFIILSETGEYFKSRLTYNGFLGNVTESLSVVWPAEDAGKFIVNKVLHGVTLLLI